MGRERGGNPLTRTRIQVKFHAMIAQHAARKRTEKGTGYIESGPPHEPFGPEGYCTCCGRTGQEGARALEISGNGHQVVVNFHACAECRADLREHLS